MDNLQNQKFKKKVFWITLAIACCLVLSGFVVEKIASYSLLKYPGIKFGTFGLHLARIPTREELGHKNLIVLLGNSVYQYNGIPTMMQQIADENHNPLAFMNMAQVSSTVYDNLAQAAKVITTHPDLVVISFNEGTFSLKPKFKTDCTQFLFNPDVFQYMPVSFYFRFFTYQTGIDAVLSTLIPLKRVDPLICWKAKLRDRLPGWFLKWLSYPNLSIATGGIVNTVQMIKLEKTPNEEKFIAFQELLDMLQKNKIPVLFIWQEALTKEEKNSIYDVIKNMIEKRDNTSFVDLTSYWNQNDFVDMLHPTPEEAPRYAMRHYHAVSQALAFFENKMQKRTQRQ